MSLIEEIKEKTDIVELISGYVPGLKSYGRNFKALCPFHSEKTPSFFVFPDKGTWRCFGACATGGDIFSFVMKKENVDFKEALRFLAERAGITIAPRDEERERAFERLYQANEAAAAYYHSLLTGSPLAGHARTYLENRGVDKKTVEEFRLGFSLDSWDGLSLHLKKKGFGEEELLAAGLVTRKEGGTSYDLFRGRLMFPIDNVQGRTCGFGARALDSSGPKYLNSPQTVIFDKGGMLYGIDRARSAIRNEGVAIIVEGYTDVIASHQHGIANVVASMGTALGERQVSTLKRYAKSIVMAMDADAAGKEATLRELDSMWRAAWMRRSTDGRIMEETEVKVAELPAGRDPDNLVREDLDEFKRLIDGAQPWMDFLFNMFLAPLDLSSAEGKSAAVKRLGPYISAIPYPIRRAHYIQRLSRLIGVNEQTIAMSIRQNGPRRGEKEAVKPVSRSWSDPLEEYCLSLLLKYPYLHDEGLGLSVEHFERSENREIFLACEGWRDPDGFRESLDVSLHEHLDRLMGKEFPPASDKDLELGLLESARRLKERKLRNLKIKEELLLSEPSSGGIEELEALEDHVIEVNSQLREVFSRGRSRKRRKGRGP